MVTSKSTRLDEFNAARRVARLHRRVSVTLRSHRTSFIYSPAFKKTLGLIALNKVTAIRGAWEPQSRTGSEAKRSDRVHVECHKQAEATWTAVEYRSTRTRSLRSASLPVLLSLLFSVVYCDHGKTF